MIFQVYRARRGLLKRNQWRWRLKADNGRVIADSAESYNNRLDCLSMVAAIIGLPTNTAVEVG